MIHETRREITTDTDREKERERERVRNFKNQKEMNDKRKMERERERERKRERERRKWTRKKENPRFETRLCRINNNEGALNFDEENVPHNRGERCKEVTIWWPGVYHSIMTEEIDYSLG